jgi:hypothetical protein
MAKYVIERVMRFSSPQKIAGNEPARPGGNVSASIERQRPSWYRDSRRKQSFFGRRQKMLAATGLIYPMRGFLRNWLLGGLLEGVRSLAFWSSNVKAAIISAATVERREPPPPHDADCRSCPRSNTGKRADRFANWWANDCPTDTQPSMQMSLDSMLVLARAASLLILRGASLAKVATL